MAVHNNTVENARCQASERSGSISFEKYVTSSVDPFLYFIPIEVRRLFQSSTVPSGVATKFWYAGKASMI